MRIIHSWWKQLAIPTIIFVNLLFVLLATVNLWQDIGRPFGGVITEQAIDGDFFIYSASPDWWSGLQPSVLERFDRLLLINGLPYTTENEKTIFASASVAENSTAQLLVHRQDKEIVVNLPVVFFTYQHFFDFHFILFFTSLGFCVVAIAIYMADPQNPQNRIIALVNANLMLIGIQRSSLFWYESTFEQALGLIGRPLGVSLGFLSFHFALLYPYKSRLWQPPVIIASVIIYWIAAFFRILARAAYLGGANDDFITQIEQYNFTWPFLFFGMFSVLIRFSLLWKQNKLNEMEKRIISRLWPLIFSLIVVMTFQFINYKKYNSYQTFIKNLDLRLIYSLAPITVIYLMLRYGAFRNRKFFGLLRGAFLILTSVFITGVFHGIWLSGSAQFLEQSPFIYFFIAALITGTTWFVMGSFRSLLRKRLNLETDLLTEVKRFTNQIQHDQNDQFLITNIVDLLCKEFSVSASALWQWDNHQNKFILSAQAGTWSTPLPETISYQRREPIKSNYYWLGQKHQPSWLNPISVMNEVALAIPLRIDIQLIGLLAVGALDKASLTDRSANIFVLLAQQCALFIHTAQSAAKLRQVPVQISDIQEKERENLAIQLQQNTGEFLAELQYHLETSLRKLEKNPVSTSRELGSYNGAIKAFSNQLRQTCHRLAPPTINENIIDALYRMISDLKVTQGKQIVLTIDEEAQIILAPTISKTIYYIVEQSLDFICTSENFNPVKIYVKWDKESIYLEINSIMSQKYDVALIHQTIQTMNFRAGLHKGVVKNLSQKERFIKIICTIPI